jgi:hypothetical protein
MRRPNRKESTMHNASRQRLDRLLTEFEQAYDDGSGWTRHLRQAIDASPVLLTNLERAVGDGHLTGFALSPQGAVENNAYSPGEKKILLNEETLREARPDGPRVGELVFALGHETDHALRLLENAASRKAFHDAADKIVQTFDVPYHDYTAPLRDMLEARRTDEAKAHLAGYSAHHAWVIENNPSASLEDIHASLPGRMNDFIDVLPAGDWTYCVLKPGLKNEDFLSHDLGQSEKNVKAMKQYYYDKDASEAGLGPNGDLDYRHHDAAQLMDLIDENDRFIHRRGTDVRKPGAPRVVIDLDALGLDGTKLRTRLPYITPQDILAETNGRGTKRTFEPPQPKHDGTHPTDPIPAKRARATPGEGGALPDPATDGRPGADHPFYLRAIELLRDNPKVPRMDAVTFDNVAAGIAFEASQKNWSVIHMVTASKDGRHVFALDREPRQQPIDDIHIDIAQWRQRPATDTLAKLAALGPSQAAASPTHHPSIGGP